MTTYLMTPDDEEFSLDDIYEDITDDCKALTNAGAIGTLQSESRAHIEELEKLVPMLPKVTESGTSECPYASEMYAKKDDLVAELSKNAKALMAYKSVIDAELDRCERNRMRLYTDETRLNEPDPRVNYEEAFDKLEDEEERIRQHWAELNELRMRIDKATNFAGRRGTPEPMRRLNDQAKRRDGQRVFGGDTSVGKLTDELIAAGPAL